MQNLKLVGVQPLFGSIDENNINLLAMVLPIHFSANWKLDLMS
jgi:hypothetical protein